MPSGLKIKSGSSRFFDQEQVSLPPLGQRYGNNPTVSQSQGSTDFQLRCSKEWPCAGRTHPFGLTSVSVSHQTSVHLSSVSPSFIPGCFQGGVLPSRACVKLCESVVSITFLTWLITSRITKRLSLVLFGGFFFPVL